MESKTEVIGAVKAGRRKIDWHAWFTGEAQVSIFYWFLGMFLDDKKKPSMARILLAFWTFIGWRMITHEIHLQAGQPAILNAAWTAWYAFGGCLAVAVFGPRVASYFAPGAAGAVAATAIGSAARDAVQRRVQAAKIGHDGEEYDDS